MAVHIRDGQFQSDKYPTCPPGKVPLSVKDPTAQDLLWAYAQRRRSVDAEFSEDLEACLKAAGYVPTPWLTGVDEVELRMRAQATKTGEGPALTGHDAERLLATLHNARGVWLRTLSEQSDKLEAALTRVAELEGVIRRVRGEVQHVSTSYSETGKLP